MDQVRAVMLDLKIPLKYRETLVANITAVLDELKPAFLVDVGNLSKTALTEIVTAINKVLEQPNLLFLIVVNKDENFICNRKIFDKQRFKSRTFIDITKKLNVPRLCDVIQVDQIETMAKRMLEIIKDKLESKDSVIELELEQCWNPSTAFGILLGYPVVYFYEDLETCTNCLNCVELKLIKLLLNNFAVASFSYPKSLDSQVSDMIKLWKEDIQTKPRANVKLQDTVVSLESVVL